MLKGTKAEKKRRKLYRRLIKLANEVFDMGFRCQSVVMTRSEVKGVLAQMIGIHLLMARFLTEAGRG